MRITVLGLGHVGLVFGACCAELGNDVVCADADAAKVEGLKHGGMPFHEPGLADMVRKNVGVGRLLFTSDMDYAIAHGVVLIVAVGTPSAPDGSADTRDVISVARSIGRSMREFRVVVNKSTAPVGTVERIHLTIDEELRNRGVSIGFSVISNPEFLREGTAIDDFMRPDRIIVGSSDDRATELMRQLYSPIMCDCDRLVVIDPRSAELTKYAANSMLALRVSFMNEIANLAEAVGADIESIRRGIGLDRRIGFGFLNAGLGYGGPCLPKDIRALQHIAAEQGCKVRIIDAIQQVNDERCHRVVDQIRMRFGHSLDARHFAIWGLAFKPNTDDMREAVSRLVIIELLKYGATVTAYDPVSAEAARNEYRFKSAVTIAQSSSAALDHADALIIATESKEFRCPDFGEMKRRMKLPVVFDGRNIFDPIVIRGAGFEYHSIGRPSRARG